MVMLFMRFFVPRAFWLFAVFSKRLFFWLWSLSNAFKHWVTSFCIIYDFLGNFFRCSFSIGSVTTNELVSGSFLFFKFVGLNFGIISEFFSLFCFFLFSSFNLFFSFFRLFLFLCGICSCILGGFFGIFKITLLFKGLSDFNLFFDSFCWLTISGWLFFTFIANRIGWNCRSLFCISWSHRGCFGISWGFFGGHSIILLNMGLVMMVHMREMNFLRGFRSWGRCLSGCLSGTLFCLQHRVARLMVVINLVSNLINRPFAVWAVNACLGISLCLSSVNFVLFLLDFSSEHFGFLLCLLLFLLEGFWSFFL